MRSRCAYVYVRVRIYACVCTCVCMRRAIMFVRAWMRVSARGFARACAFACACVRGFAHARATAPEPGGLSSLADSHAHIRKRTRTHMPASRAPSPCVTPTTGRFQPCHDLACPFENMVCIPVEHSNPPYQCKCLLGYMGFGCNERESPPHRSPLSPHPRPLSPKERSHSR